MSLTQDLADFKANFITTARAKFGPETTATMEQATTDLQASGLVDRSLAVGATAPDFTLANVTGAAVSLRSLLENGPVVLSFYRGGWCPYCNLELRALQNVLPQIQALGANLVAISPETPDNSLTTSEKNELSFAVLSDVGNRVAREFGLVFTLPEALRPIYEGFGIDLPAHNGDDRFELPVPATYVIDTDGRIAHAFANVDYTQRLDPEAILAALERLQAPVESA